jgi:pyruvate dehydrogenase (quinone)
MSKNVAQVIVEMLQAARVKRCYGIVADTINRFSRAIDGIDIKWVHMRHEEAGAFAASAEAQLTSQGCSWPGRQDETRAHHRHPTARATVG